MVEVDVIPPEATEAPRKAKNFIIAVTTKSIYDSPYVGPIPKHLRSSVYGPIVEELIERDTALIATPRGQPGVYVGFILGRRSKKHPIIHSVFTKKKFRRMGVGKAMLNAFGVNTAMTFFYTFKPKGNEIRQVIDHYRTAAFRPARID